MILYQSMHWRGHDVGGFEAVAVERGFESWREVGGDGSAEAYRKCVVAG